MELSSEFRRRKYPKDIVPKNEVKRVRRVRTPQQDNRKWAPIESTISFNFNNLLKRVREHLEGQYPEATREQITYKIGDSLKTFSINNQVFNYEAVPNTLGGVRWFVLCPECSKKSLKLFLPKLPDREPLYLCKDCHRLKPSSMLLYNNKKYKHITRPLNRLDKIKKKLLCRKKLSTEEVEALFKEYDKIEEKLVNSPEYRLWKFKREHGRSM
jgi:hypothetical protein